MELKYFVENKETESYDDVTDYVKELETANAELLETANELLEDAKSFYSYYPNNFRATAEEYFLDEIKTLNKYNQEG